MKIKELLSTLNNNEKSALFDELFSHYLSHGYQSLSKKDLDLLLYHIVTRNSFGRKSVSMAELARVLRIPINKVRSLRIESELRWAEIDNKSIIERVVRRTFSDKNIKYLRSAQSDTLNSGKIPIVVEDPIEKFSLEEVVKSDGGIIDYRFNQDVIEVDTEALLRMAQTYYSDQQKLYKSIQEKTKAESTINDILTRKDISEITGSDVRKLINEAGASLIKDGGKETLKAVVKLLFPFSGGVVPTV